MPLIAQYTRDDTYLHAAVVDTYATRELARFFSPIAAAAGAGLIFSPWGALGVIAEPSYKAVFAALPLILLALFFLMASSVFTISTLMKVTTKGFRFRGDTAEWRFDEARVSYRLNGGERYAADGVWAYYLALRYSDAGIVIQRSRAEHFFIPHSAFAQASDAQRVLTWARSAGLKTEVAPARAMWGVVGCTLAAALLLCLTLTLASLLAALPFSQLSRVSRLFTSGVDTFWWVALIAATLIVMPSHGLLTRSRFSNLRTHAALGVFFGLLAANGAHAMRHWVFDERLQSANLMALEPLVIAGSIGAVCGVLIYVHWSPGLSALQTIGSKNSCAH